MSRVRTRYFEKGEGKPLILLHGSNFGADTSADCAANWSRNFDASPNGRMSSRSTGWAKA